MFRLLKLMAFALFGYAVYEFFRGMSDTSGGGMGGQRSFGGGVGGRSEAFGLSPGQGQISGEGQGREEETLNTDGGSVRHRVGRGVVSGM
jgi:hypothetical protein